MDSGFSQLQVLGHNVTLFNDQQVDLYRRSSMPSGIYRCDIATKTYSDQKESVYLGLYNNGGNYYKHYLCDIQDYYYTYMAGRHFRHLYSIQLEQA